MKPESFNPEPVGPEELGQLLDGALTPERVREVEAALQRDPALRAEWKRQRALADLLALDADAEVAAPQKETRLAASVHAHINASARWKVAAAAAILVGAGLFFWVHEAAPVPASIAPAAVDYAALVPPAVATSLEATIDEIEWVQASWLPRG